MLDFAYELKIPKERVAVLIGKEGKIKSQIEIQSQTRLLIDSVEGDVRIRGSDPIRLFSCREIVRAIGRGFNPEAALQLLKQDVTLEVISIDSYASNQSQFERLRGRVIGEGGKARRVLEELTGVSISVYGKTVSLLGDYEGMVIARRAIDSLLNGSRHATVYSWLERQRRQMKSRRITDSANSFK